MVNNPQEMMKRSCHQYMEALEDERRKIQVFHRELPLCLELVNQAIENCKRQLSCSERADCEEQMQMTTMSIEGPVLEEFIPLKRSPSSECEEEQSEHDKSDDNKLGKKVDWLRSVQLWNHTTDLSSKEEDSPGKHSVIEAKKNGGAFHPFRKEKSETTTTTTATTTTTTATRTATPAAAASSTADNGNKSSREDKSQSNKKTRRCWSPELHRRFLQALQQLGGSHAATPKQIRELMKVDGLTNDEVKSHLQKYRLHTRRPGTPHIQTTAATTTSPQATQFVVVGGIWVPPPEYAATMASSKGDAPPPACTKGIYVPVAAPAPPPQQAPQLTLSSCTQQQQQQQQQKQKQMVLQRPAVVGSSHVSDGRSSRGSGGRTHDSSAHSPTPTCSSTDTTTASPALF